jgi:hypothetical protein
MVGMDLIRLQMAGILVDQNISQKMLKALKAAVIINPLIFVFLVLYMLIPSHIDTKLISAAFSLVSISIAVITTISGWAFRRSLSKYFQGVLIARVRIL